MSFILPIPQELFSYVDSKGGQETLANAVRYSIWAIWEQTPRNKPDSLVVKIIKSGKVEHKTDSTKPKSFMQLDSLACGSADPCFGVEAVFNKGHADVKEEMIAAGKKGIDAVLEKVWLLVRGFDVSIRGILALLSIR